MVMSQGVFSSLICKLDVININSNIYYLITMISYKKESIISKHLPLLYYVLMCHKTFILCAYTPTSIRQVEWRHSNIRFRSSPYHVNDSLVMEDMCVEHGLWRNSSSGISLKRSLGIIYKSTLHTPYNARRLGDLHRLKIWKILPSNCPGKRWGGMGAKF